MSDFSSWSLSSGSCRLDLHGVLTGEHSEHPMLASFMPTAVGFYHRAAGHFMRRLEHDEHLVGYVVSGHGYLQIGEGLDQIYEIGPGSLFWVPPTVSHYYYASPSKPWSVYWAHLQKAETEIIYDLIDFSKGPVVDVGIHQGLIQDFDRILLDLRTHPESLAQLTFVSAGLRAWLCEVAVIVKNLRSTPDSLVDRANRVFSENLGEKFSLEKIAAEFNLSKYHFSRKYKKLTGRTPVNAFMEYKINHACELIEEKELSISQVAYQLGFQDEAYFTKVFVRHIGLTPSKYRAALNKQ